MGPNKTLQPTSREPSVRRRRGHSSRRMWLIAKVVRQQQIVALRERIIQASSNEGDVVLDPFCGCGTTIAAAQKLNRDWIGIDVTHLNVGLMKLRLKNSFGMLRAGTKTIHRRDRESTEKDSLKDLSDLSALW